jgi:ribosome-associated translation inhibitor RaiA
MLNITFRNLESSLTIRSLAEELLAKLVRSHDEPAHAHLVLADERGAHAHCEDRFAAHLELSFAHGAMSFQSQSSSTDAAVAVREVFEHVERQIARQAGRRESHKRSERGGAA